MPKTGFLASQLNHLQHFHRMAALIWMEKLNWKLSAGSVFHFVTPYRTKKLKNHRAQALTVIFLYPRHLSRGVYSFCLSVRMFVRLFVRTSFCRVEFASKFCVKVSQVVYISAITLQKAFLFEP